MAENATTVRITTDVRTTNPEGLIKTLKTEGDNLGDYLVSVVLPSYGFEDKAKAGGTYVHAHEEGDRLCKDLAQTDRLWRQDGQDEL